MSSSRNSLRRPPARPPDRRPLVFILLAVVALAAAGGALLLRLRDSEGVVLVETTGYTEGVAGTWQRINPLFSSANEVDADLSALIFAGLVRLGPDGQVIPSMAELPAISDDGRTYTFRLKDGLRWHDGQPLTSRDIAFTVSRLTDPEFRGDAALAESWAGVEVATPDAVTVVFSLRQASAPFLARQATIGILPQHLLDGLSGQALYEAPFNALPVGSGPFRLQSVDAREAVLAAFDGYVQGRPEIDTFRIRFFADYPAAMQAALTREIDGLLLREGLTEAQSAELERAKDTQTIPLQRAAYLMLYLNNDQAAFFADARVRRAISLALDRDRIAREVFGGAAFASASAIPPGTWAYEPEFDARALQIDEAKRLLADAGWVAHPTTGILIREGGEFRFTIRTDNDPLRVALATEIAAELEPLGIRVTVASTTFSVLRKDFLQERRYEAAVAGWDQGADPDPYFGWHSSQLGSAGLNLANFGDQVADELIAKARTTTDLEVRAGLYGQFQERWEELVPSVVVAYPQYRYVQSESLEGFDAPVLFTASQRFWDVETWKK